MWACRVYSVSVVVTLILNALTGCKSQTPDWLSAAVCHTAALRNMWRITFHLTAYTYEVIHEIIRVSHLTITVPQPLLLKLPNIVEMTTTFALLVSS